MFYRFEFHGDYRRIYASPNGVPARSWADAFFCPLPYNLTASPVFTIYIHSELLRPDRFPEMMFLPSTATTTPLCRPVPYHDVVGLTVQGLERPRHHADADLSDVCMPDAEERVSPVQYDLDTDLAYWLPPAVRKGGGNRRDQQDHHCVCCENVLHGYSPFNDSDMPSGGTRSWRYLNGRTTKKRIFPRKNARWSLRRNITSFNEE